MQVVGYCQGMNFIAGIMLLFLGEESAFWLLCALLEYILPADYYAQDLSGCNVDLRVFKNCKPACTLVPIDQEDQEHVFWRK